jgi:hypothetical protein
VTIGGLSAAFEESHASSVEVLVEGKAFYPPMLEDIAAAASSIHINQFGFRPGRVGDRFADALVAKAREGVPVRLIVDRQGTDPERGSRELFERLTGAGIQVCVNRATKARVARGPLGAGGAMGWNLRGLGHIDHRKVVVVDGRIGWVGGAGIEDHFENGEFVYKFGSEEEAKGYCLYPVGCKGPQTFTNCPIVRWNDNVSWCVGSGSPCIGCGGYNWVDQNAPFLKRFRQIGLGNGANGGGFAPGMVAGAAAAVVGVGLVAHGVGSAATGRTKGGAPVETEKVWDAKHKKGGGN